MSDSGISFPVVRKECWERALNKAQQDHERKESIQQDVQGENQNTFERVKVKVPPKPYEPTKEERQSHEATHCPCRARCEICDKVKKEEPWQPPETRPQFQSQNKVFKRSKASILLTQNHRRQRQLQSQLCSCQK